MGCSSSSDAAQEPVNDAPPRKVDPRLPFETYRQLFNMKNSWKAIARKLEPTAKDCLLRLLKKHPEYHQMFDSFKNLDLTNEEAVNDNMAFENQAVAIFTVFDDVMENADGKVDNAIYELNRAGKIHAKIENFQVEMFTNMEGPFIEACRQTLDDRFTDAAEQNFLRLFQFCAKHMQEGYNSAG